MTERENMLNRVRMYDFAMVDVAEFLDGHPKNTTAMAYYSKMREARDKARDEFQKAYGPLSIMSVDTKDGMWTWVNDPWPWEGADN